MVLGRRVAPPRRPGAPRSPFQPDRARSPTTCRRSALLTHPPSSIAHQAGFFQRPARSLVNREPHALSRDFGVLERPRWAGPRWAGAHRGPDADVPVLDGPCAPPDSPAGGDCRLMGPASFQRASAGSVGSSFRSEIFWPFRCHGDVRPLGAELQPVPLCSFFRSVGNFSSPVESHRTLPRIAPGALRCTTIPMNSPASRRPMFS